MLLARTAFDDRIDRISLSALMADAVLRYELLDTNRGRRPTTASSSSWKPI